mmetsp:Transcript_52094/g.124048  ORF Transcript_52094/g.124048 Transcript_52094/m.124048 type:complete len:212 (-) Transcript_52094:1538-2173(-)
MDGLDPSQPSRSWESLSCIQARIPQMRPEEAMLQQRARPDLAQRARSRRQAARTEMSCRTCSRSRQFKERIGKGRRQCPKLEEGQRTLPSGRTQGGTRRQKKKRIGRMTGTQEKRIGTRRTERTRRLPKTSRGEDRCRGHLAGYENGLDLEMDLAGRDHVPVASVADAGTAEAAHLDLLLGRRRSQQLHLLQATSAPLRGQHPLLDHQLRR